jgi:hypothetical protein
VHRHEELAGGRDAQAHGAGKAGAEAACRVSSRLRPPGRAPRSRARAATTANPSTSGRATRVAKYRT